VGSIRRAQTGSDFFGLAAGVAYLGDDGGRFLLAAAVVHDHLSAGLRERQSRRAADAP